MNTVAPQSFETVVRESSDCPSGSDQYFCARDIARALGLSGGGGKKKIHRTAVIEQWPSKFIGNKLVFIPPASIAELIVEPPTSESAPAAPMVRFSDLIHDKAARDTVLLREKSVLMVRENTHLGKEVALKLVASHMAIEHLTFRISVSSLRQWCVKYAAHGIDGLVEQKRGVVGRKPFAAQLDEHHLLAAAAGSVERGIKGRLNAARGYRDALLNNPTINGPARLWMHGEHATKSYVPPSVREAIKQRASPLATSLIQIGPKAAKLAGPYTECTYDNIKAGDAFTADDMTANCYVWCEWPNEDGFILIRPQILAAMDIGSMAWLNIRAVMRPKGQYNQDDVWGLIGDVFDEYGLFNTAILEGGTWQSRVVTGHQTGVDDEARFGGLKSLGVKLIHTRTPRGKIIETAFNSLQHAADNVRGFCGRMEMKDCPEIVRQQLAQVKAGHAHPRQFFLHVSEYTRHLEGVMNALNHERNDGKILKGLAPVDKWAEDAPQMRVMPDSHKWMYRAAYRVLAVTRNGLRIAVGTGKYQSTYTYSNPEKLENHRGRKVVVFWNDYDPDTDAVVYTLRNGQPDQFICVASRVTGPSRLGASAEELHGEATRKKLSMQHARTQKASLAPFLQRSERVIAPPASEVGKRIAQAKTDNTVRQRARKTLRDFVGGAEVLLGRGADVSPADNVAPAQPPVEAVPSLEENAGKFTYHLKSSGSDQAQYVDYLLTRLTEFRKSGASFGQQYHANVTVAITKKIAAGQLKCDLHDAARFDEICEHLKSKIDATILGKRNTAKGSPNYHAFETTSNLSAEALLG
jgi:hypothetical protein